MFIKILVERFFDIVTIFGVRVVESQLEVLLMTKKLLAEEISASNRHLQQR